jgi:prevent-host-death family protein
MELEYETYGQHRMNKPAREKRMQTLDATTARDEFADMLNRAAYGKERVILTRRGRELAAVVPIEDVRLLEALEERMELQDARAALAEAVLLEHMLASSASFLKSRGCGLLLWDRGTNRVTALIPFAGLDGPRVQQLSFPVEGAALAPVVNDRRPIVLNDLAGPSADSVAFHAAGMHHVLGAPLATQREVMGICLAFDRNSGEGFDDEDATVLTIMARQMASVLDVTRQQRSGAPRWEPGLRLS